MKEKIIKLIENGLVGVKKHPEKELYIYNYTPKAQYERLWDDMTLQCRGLILDGEYNIVSKPFKKFFNLEEHKLEEIPQLPFDVYEKLDGSLGILYWVGDKPFIASRGSFNSEQAIRATEILYRKYQHIFNKIDRNSTYLFEIIYPENRIVVDYQNTEDIFLLTVINNLTEMERIEFIGFPVVKKYDGIKDFRTLKEMEETNREGFVVRFSNGFRIKIKFEEYIRLHKILTNVSNVDIWAYLKYKSSFDELLSKVPDEFYGWVTETINDLKIKYREILEDAKLSFKIFETRKETAEYFKTQRIPKVLFAMLDNKDYETMIWDLIKPKMSKPFKKTEQ